MRIKQINVKSLFGIFNHEIHLNMDERITIIHGPNGIGKTYILRMLHSLFYRNYHHFLEYPFKEFKVLFDDESEVIVNRIEGNKKEGPVLKISNKKEGKVVKGNKFQVPYFSRREEFYIRRFIDRQIPSLRRLDDDVWIDERNKQIMTFFDISVRFPDEVAYLSKDLARKGISKESLTLLNDKWLQTIVEKVIVQFIRAQRLIITEGDEYIYHRESKSMTDSVVEFYSKDIKGLINDVMREYNTKSQRLDREFPRKLLEGEVNKSIDSSNILNELKELENRRDKLAEAGLLQEESKSPAIPYSTYSTIDIKKKEDMLSIYIENEKEKLSVYNDIFNKIEIFVSILNSTYQYKNISIEADRGFVLETDSGNELTVKKLSSGEQHELVLLYQLLFKTHTKMNSKNKNTLFLIDEPEISLHIAWQHKFLDDLKEIIDLIGFDVLIATHSPQIIHGKNNLMVELLGPKK
ncbi:MAG: AAA family ATPase [Deltaproteobacteria bacterium]|nr:AAA family ATPase [Candidatus Zymogenaceae bacterium]